MTGDPSSPSGDEHRRAAELAAHARELHEQERYYEARDFYRQSLALHEDEEVRAWYSRLMATIGPK